jgi:hypothetical protein
VTDSSGVKHMAPVDINGRVIIVDAEHIHLPVTESNDDTKKIIIDI